MGGGAALERGGRPGTSDREAFQEVAMAAAEAERMLGQSLVDLNELVGEH